MSTSLNQTETSAQLKRALLALKTARAKLEEVSQARHGPIAIIGMACRFPGNVNTPQEFWQLLQQGEEGIGDIPEERWAADAYYDPDPNVPGKMYTRHGGFISGATLFDAQFFSIAPREAMRMDPQQRLLLEVSWEALEHAGQNVQRLAGSDTGVFVGISDNQFSQRQIQIEGEICIDDPNFLLGSSCSAATGRLSYMFDFRGPNMAVNTACSSSLVALHLACQSLRNQECSMAIVGGVHVITSPETFINYCKMGMLSVDGRCKTFDASADGFGVGEGCGVVVLKRLQDAQQAGDPILAVIRGSAVNEDGYSNGLTAPNGLSQQAVIRQALANAGVSPDLVSYVEAHGSGTELGDPIELESIQAVLCQARAAEQPLFVGSVKTNLGHLTTAAGMGGLIKTVLSLQHQAIPPHLHLQKPNPYIAWDEARFQVPTELTPWQPVNGRRIAGVSSFGWAGTNAHAILEEAPTLADTPQSQSRSLYMLSLSAQTESALTQAAANLATYLRQHPTASLADVAYTLQTGRAEFDFRRIIFCRNHEEAIAALESPDSQNVLNALIPDKVYGVSFMFPGLGDQYIGMAAGLYQTEPVFKHYVDHCCELLQPYLNVDLRHLLYPPESNTERSASTQTGPDLRQMLGRSGQQKETDNALKRTSLAQPAVFVLEYALAQLWISWGIRPKAMIGYSLGEYVAACLSGVFSLEDALRLVAQRAQMIDTLPPGAMLAVALPEDKLMEFLDDSLCLSGNNGPLMCVAAGPPAAVADLEQKLVANDIACRQIPTTHAFHSKMLEPIMASLTDLVKEVELRPPQIPYISNVTGTWITAAQAVDPSYWATHMRQAVRFADGLEQLWGKPGNILLEVGVGQMLGSLALQHPARGTAVNPVVISSLPGAYESKSDTAALLRSLGQLWLSGAAIDWSGVHAHEQLRRLQLPTYPFAPQQYWTRPTDGGRLPVVSPGLSVSAAPMSKKGVPDWFHVPTWQRVPFLSENGRNASKQWLLFADSWGLGDELAKLLRQQGHSVVIVTRGDSFQRVQEDLYTIEPQTNEAYSELIKHLSLINKVPDRIVHAWNVWPKTEPNVNLDTVEKAQDLGFYSLLFLAQALGKQQLSNSVQIQVISNNMQDVLGGEGDCPEKSSLLGMVRVIPQEYTQIECMSIDVALPAQVETLAAQLLPELMGNTSDAVVAYRGRSRWVQSFTAVPLADEKSGRDRLRSQGVYLITGGFGGLGAALARALAKQLQARLVLVGRSVLPPRSMWPGILAGESEDQHVRERVQQILDLESMGADVLAAAADVADLAQMQQVVDEAHARFGHIDGVFHTAGVPGEGLIQGKTTDVAAQVLRPKLQGAVVLDAVLHDENLDFMVFYSSLGAVMGGLGEVDYCAANAFLDAFAHYMSYQRMIPTVSINWGLWQWDAWQSAMTETVPKVYEQIKQMRQIYGITFAEGEEALWRILATPLPQVLVSSLDLQATVTRQYSFTISDFLENMSQTPQQSAHPRPNLRNPYVAPRNETERQIAAVWGDVLAIESIGIHDHFMELGGNSLLGMMVISRLKQLFDVPLSAASLYEGPTVSELCKLIQPNGEDNEALLANLERGKKRKELRQRRNRR